MKQKHIVIIGGGYAGMMCAIRLSGKIKKLSHTITLINGSDKFIERPRLHETATNVDVRTMSIADLLDGTGVKFIQDWVISLSPNDKTISLQNQSISYDYLIYAVGSKIYTQAIDGIDDHAYVLHPYGDNSALELKDRLKGFDKQSGKVTVVGSGATGIEGAGHIKALYPHLDVTIVTAGEFATFKGARVQKHIQSAMLEQGINIVDHQPVSTIEKDRLVFKQGGTMPFDICLWAGGFIAPSLAKDAGLACNDRNQVWVDACLHPQGYDDIYVLGDAMIPQVDLGTPVRMSIMVAMVSGATTADNLSRRLRGKSERPMSFAYYGQGIAMGTQDAVGFMTYPADHVVGLVLRRKLAVHVRNFFVWLLAFFLKVEKRVPGAFIWFGKNRYQAPQEKLRHDGQVPKPISNASP